MRILVNAYNARGGGYRAVAYNLLRELLRGDAEGEDRHEVFFFGPPDLCGEFQATNRVQLRTVPPPLGQASLLPVVVHGYFPCFIRKHGIDAVFTMGNFAIRTGRPQLLLFHWPYPVYPESPVWELMDTRSRWYRRIRCRIFRSCLRHADRVIVQTGAMRERTERILGAKDVLVLPNPPAHPQEEAREFSLPVGLKLLYPAFYYPHKNLEILEPVAERIRKTGCNWRILVTLDPSVRGAAAFLGRIQAKGLSEVVINLGPVTGRHMPSLYRQVNALVFPSLLETYGLPYVEAMEQGLPIVTSDLDFARSVCGDSALYFDPHDPNDVFRAVEDLVNDPEGCSRRVATYSGLLRKIPSWEELSARYLEELGNIARPKVLSN